MFYVPLSAQSAMDITKLVQKKLGQEVVCKQAVECVKIDGGKRFLRFAAIAEENSEQAVFIFTSSRIPCLQSSDLSMETVIAIDARFRQQAEIPSKQDKPSAECRLHLKSDNNHILLEMPCQDTNTNFLTTVERLAKNKIPSKQDKPSAECRLHLKSDNNHILLEMPCQDTNTNFLTTVERLAKNKIPSKQDKPSAECRLHLKSDNNHILLEMPCQDTNTNFLTTVERLAKNKIPSKQDKPSAECRLHLKSDNNHILLEMPCQDTNTNFLTTVERLAKNRQSGTSAAVKPTFHWLDKYRRECPDYDETDSKTAVESNPFADDIFDPMKYVDQDQSDPFAQTTGVRQTTWYEESIPRSLQDSSSLKSASRDSLDKIVNFYEEFTESMESVQKQLGISWSADISVADKTVSKREKFVRQFLIEREDEFTDVKNLKMFCGSWNVNGKSPGESLHKWMVVDDEPPDIYAIGFQELDLSKEAFIFTDSPKEAEWQKAVKDYLHPKAKYRKVKSVRLVGILLIVYIQEKHAQHVSYIDSDSVPTGIMGFLGNKGGVSIRFTLHSTSLCFVNSHLAAHQDEFERRNSDYRDIMTRTRFRQFEPPLEILEHDIVFWIGDLNYRIDLPLDEVRTYIKKAMYKHLIEGDQLYRQMKASSDVFKGFKEGIPYFDPTYKFDSGTDTYDTSEKSRVPAWCDRILWRGQCVQQLRYSSHPQLKISDHKPVSSLFIIGVRMIEQKRYKRVYEDIMKTLDRLENDYLPQIKLDKAECVFKDVKFIESQNEIVTVANIGQIPVEFEFINKLDDPTYCRPWLKATPSKAYIQAGSFCEVIVEVYVDKTTATKLNAGDEKLEDILVLHLTGGKDSFITISGNYLISAFGSSIEALVQMRSPIREVPVADLLEIEQPGSLSRLDISQDGGRLYMVPKEIWKLVNFLHQYGLDQEDLFQQPGRNSEIQLIRDCLDTGKPQQIPDNLCIHSVAEALLLFLECLAQPVIPFGLYSQCLASSNSLLLSKQIISNLPGCHKNTFLYICGFLQELLQHSTKNGLESKFLCTMFGEVMLRQPVTSTSAKGQANSVRDRRSKLREEEAKKAAFVNHFVSHDIEM